MSSSFLWYRVKIKWINSCQTCVKRDYQIADGSMVSQKKIFGVETNSLNDQEVQMSEIADYYAFLS